MHLAFQNRQQLASPEFNSNHHTLRPLFCVFLANVPQCSHCVNILTSPTFKTHWSPDSSRIFTLSSPSFLCLNILNNHYGNRWLHLTRLPYILLFLLLAWWIYSLLKSNFLATPNFNPQSWTWQEGNPDSFSLVSLPIHEQSPAEGS